MWFLIWAVIYTLTFIIVFCSFVLIVLYFLYQGCRCLRTPKRFSPKDLIFITGAAQGIGKELVLLLAERYRSRFVVLDMRADLAEGVKREVKARGGEMWFYEVDLADSKGTEAVLGRVLAEHGCPDVLINNAAMVTGHSVESNTYEGFSKVMRVNFLAPVQITKFFLPEMIKRDKGHIVDVASIAAYQSTLYTADYAASKYALRAFNSSLRHEMREFGHNIKTTIIYPNQINTSLFKNYKPFSQYFLGILDPQKVALRIHQSIVLEEREVFIPWIIQVMSVGIQALPYYMRDWMEIFFGGRGMEGF